MQLVEKENLVRFRRNVRALIASYVPEGARTDDVLEGLAEKWNPLFDTADRENLVKDVDALVRDFVRPVRSVFQKSPLDSTRIQALAERVASSRNLARIAKKEPLKRYIELYILKCFSEI